MRNLKRMLIALLMVCVVVVGTSGCGGKGGFGSSDNSLSGSFSPKNDSIWYYVDSEDAVGKDSNLQAVFVFKDGESFIYPYNLASKVTFGEVAQKSDDEVISMMADLEKQKETEFKDFSTNTKTVCDLLISKGVFDAPVDSFNDRYDFTAVKGAFVDLSKNLGNVNFVKAPTEFKFAVFTDSTGNDVNKEVISYRCSVFNNTNSFFGGLVNNKIYSDGIESSSGINGSLGDVCKNLNYSFKTTKEARTDGVKGSLIKASGFSDDVIKKDFLNTNSLYPVEANDITITNALDPARGSIQVYDNNYAGYICEDGLLLSKVNGSSFVMDGLDKEGVVVDPENDNLFE